MAAGLGARAFDRGGIGGLADQRGLAASALQVRGAGMGCGSPGAIGSTAPPCSAELGISSVGRGPAQAAIANGSGRGQYRARQQAGGGQVTKAQRGNSGPIRFDMAISFSDARRRNARAARWGEPAPQWLCPGLTRKPDRAIRDLVHSARGVIRIVWCERWRSTANAPSRIGAFAYAFERTKLSRNAGR
ncbi:hypothetical protein [Lysobacter capsici]|uniref:hypothetical protein n=1 Tax=Lysobacter capsici TaxID=435897 RepID=UPI0018DF1F1C|nr:hypothetical protein [Lysobacter capsici]